MHESIRLLPPYAFMPWCSVTERTGTNWPFIKMTVTVYFQLYRPPSYRWLQTHYAWSFSHLIKRHKTSAVKTTSLQRSLKSARELTEFMDSRLITKFNMSSWKYLQLRIYFILKLWGTKRPACFPPPRCLSSSNCIFMHSELNVHSSYFRVSSYVQPTEAARRKSADIITRDRDISRFPVILSQCDWFRVLSVSPFALD